MSNFITHVEIIASLQRNFKTMVIEDEDVLNWCQEVETLYVADPDSMWKYLEIPLNIVNNRVLLPSNLYKLLDVYKSPTDDTRIIYYRNGAYLNVSTDYTGTTLTVNYVGTPIDKNCIPLIHADHQAACELWCKINMFEEQSLSGKINQNVYFDWKNRFDLAIQAAKVNYRDWDAKKFAGMLAIMGDMIPHIGYQELANEHLKHI